MLEKFIVGNTPALKNGYHDIKAIASKLDSALRSSHNQQKPAEFMPICCTWSVQWT